MTAPFSCFVRGVPAPQGSKTAFVRGGKPVMIEASKNVKQWRTDVASVLQSEWMNDVLLGPMDIRLVFQFLRPPSVSEKKRPLPTVRPDIDKLARACLDAMTGIVFGDDAQVVQLWVKKEYAERSGVRITVMP